MEVVRGLTIGDGSVTPQKIYLEVDSNKVCYVVQPNGVILTSTAGKINVNYTGNGGSVLLVVPKNAIDVKISDSISISGDYFGKLTFSGVSKLTALNSYLSTIYAQNSLSVMAQGSTVLANANADKSKTSNFTTCALTAQSIGDLLLAAIANNRTYAGTLTATGGTNAGASAINTYLISRGTTLAAVLTQLATWTITLNA